MVILGTQLFLTNNYAVQKKQRVDMPWIHQLPTTRWATEMMPNAKLQDFLNDLQGFLATEEKRAILDN